MAWHTNSKGNHTFFDESGTLVGTVFRKAPGHQWQVIINKDGAGHLAANQNFNVPEDARELIKDYTEGLELQLIPLGQPSTTPSNTSWMQTSKFSNGAPVYSRRHNGKGVSVKQASNGNWFYVVHQTNPKADGWSDTAQKAMRSFDRQHP